MRVGVIQSNYLPWRGYLDFIRQVDLFVFYDDVQYSKNDWRNRNRIKTEAGLRWITVPVRHERLSQLIDETQIDDTQDWARTHLLKLEQSYGAAPHYERYRAPLAEILRKPHASISDLNIELLGWLMRELGIRTPTLRSRELALTGSRNERLIQLLGKVGAAVYLSGPAARAYIDVEQFRRAGLGLEYKAYDYPEYPQLHGPFEGAVTVLDLLFHVGPEAPRYLECRTPNERVL